MNYPAIQRDLFCIKEHLGELLNPYLKEVLQASITLNTICQRVASRTSSSDPTMKALDQELDTNLRYLFGMLDKWHGEAQEKLGQASPYIKTFVS